MLLVTNGGEVSVLTECCCKLVECIKVDGALATSSGDFCSNFCNDKSRQQRLCSVRYLLLPVGAVGVPVDTRLAKLALVPSVLKATSTSDPELS